MLDNYLTKLWVGGGRGGVSAVNISYIKTKHFFMYNLSRSQSLLPKD